MLPLLTTAVAVLSTITPFVSQSPLVNEPAAGRVNPGGAVEGGCVTGRPNVIVEGSAVVSFVSVPSFVPLLFKSVSTEYLLAEINETFMVQSFFIALARSDEKSLKTFQTSFSRLLYFEKLFKRINTEALIIPMIISANDISITVKPPFFLI